MQLTIDHVFEESIRNVLDAAVTGRRLNQRHPFFRPVSITIGDVQGTKLSAFSRDMSPAAIGLVSKTPVKPQRVTLDLPTVMSHHIQLRTDITWCEPWDEGWYLSEGQFVGLTTLQVVELRLMIGTLQIHRRLNQRHPFFRLVSITNGRAQGTKLSAFSRDVSATGIGLFHNMPLEARRVALSIPTTAGDQVELSTEIKWCEACGEGCYLSGGRFTKPSIQELPDLMM